VITKKTDDLYTLTEKLRFNMAFMAANFDSDKSEECPAEQLSGGALAVSNLRFTQRD